MTVLEKECFKCNTIRPLSEFYRHKAMADGTLNKCKLCTKADTIKNRKAKINYYREYDKRRGNRQTAEDTGKYRLNNPNKYSAHILVNNAVRSGKINKGACEICGVFIGVHAHHDDYSKPLDVRWLCPEHHNKWHKENGEGKNM